MREAASSSARVTLGVDIGTTSIRMVALEIGKEAGEIHELRATSRTMYRPAAVNGELEPSTVWSTFVRGLRQIQTHLSSETIVAIGLAGMAEAGCMLNGGRPASSIRLWHDRRGTTQASALRGKDAAMFAALTGIPMTGVRSVAKWRWFVDHGWPASSRWCGVPELAMLRLTGSWNTEPSLASRFGIFDSQARTYAPELMRLAEVPSDAFAPVFDIRNGLHVIRSEVADRFGLPTSSLVGVVGHDDVVAAAGCRAEIDDLVDSAGTAEALIRICRERPDFVGAVSSGFAVAPLFDGSWALVGGPGTTGALMTEVRRQLNVPLRRLDRLAARTVPAPPGALRVRASAGAPPVAHVLSGFSAGQIWSRLLEDLSIRFVDCASRMARLVGAPSRVLFTGGGAKSEELVLRKAHRLGVTVDVRLPSFAAAYGAALLVRRGL